MRLERMWSVGDLAAVSGVTVRTLHHYDRIGLLPPSGRTPAGYRSYDEGDLLRLQRILAYRELGFSLDDIAALLDDPDTDPAEMLRRQQPDAVVVVQGANGHARQGRDLAHRPRLRDHDAPPSGARAAQRRRLRR